MDIEMQQRRGLESGKGPFVRIGDKRDLRMLKDAFRIFGKAVQAFGIDYLALYAPTLFDQPAHQLGRLDVLEIIDRRRVYGAKYLFVDEEYVAAWISKGCRIDMHGTGCSSSWGLVLVSDLGFRFRTEKAFDLRPIEPSGDQHTSRAAEQGLQDHASGGGCVSAVVPAAVPVKGFLTIREQTAA